MSYPSDLEILMRRLSDLELQKMRGMKQSDYKRLRSSVQKQINELGPAEPGTRSVTDPDARNGIFVPDEFSKAIFAQFKTRSTDKTFKIPRWPTISGIAVDWTAEVSEAYKKTIQEYFKGAANGNYYVDTQPATRFSMAGSAAEKVWKDYNGVILCECDNSDDCDRIIPIDHDAYIKACGVEGYYRITSADCPYGCLGYMLSGNDKHWKVWSK
jgi:hypothetical protein